MYNAIYSDGQFEKIELGELINRGGAAGKIFAIKEHPESVAKIFHNTHKSSSNRQKIEAMLHNPPDLPSINKDGASYIQIAWPQAILEDEQGFCVGYLMPLVDIEKAVSLDHLMQKAVRKKLDLPEQYSYRIFAAYNIASMVAAMHNCKHYIIDLKPSNIYVYKQTMTVAMIDCDGFSIEGETGNRFGAEFVSEEYIYPEGMKQSCEEMGIAQDEFAMAVIIFRLLNNGIHPFSGSPRKNDSKMLTIQERIENYNYAYGLWPDTYQAPHPYSIHDYLDPKTLELFERAFTKNLKRPSSLEWKNHISRLLENLKECKKNPEHSHFTSKGCGLCVVEEKFRGNISTLQKEKDAPKTLRGVDVSKLSNENMQKNKIEKIIHDNLLQNISFIGIGLYMIFFTFLHKIFDAFFPEKIDISIGLQATFVTILMIGINSLIKKLRDKVLIFENKSLTQMLQMYALICMIITFIKINNIPSDIFNIN